MRRCFQCGAMTVVEGLTRVGDGEFCASCFRALLGAGATASPSVAASPSAAAPPSVAATSSAARSTAEEPHRRAASARRSRVTATSRTCLVCDRDLGGAPAVVFLGGEICGPCSAEMATELQAANTEPAAAPTAPAASAAPAGEALVTEAEVEAEAAPQFTPGSGNVRCAGCERPMPGPGSYRVLHGKPYCPACLPFYARLAPALHDPSAAASVERPPSPCDCCRRALDERAERRAGFTLCSACVSSDADLALSVARARHRRELARLRSTLEGSS